MSSFTSNSGEESTLAEDLAPIEIWAYIFQYLGPHYRRLLSNVCKEWLYVARGLWSAQRLSGCRRDFYRLVNDFVLRDVILRFQDRDLDPMTPASDLAILFNGNEINLEDKVVFNFAADMADVKICVIKFTCVQLYTTIVAEDNIFHAMMLPYCIEQPVAKGIDVLSILRDIWPRNIFMHKKTIRAIFVAWRRMAHPGSNQTIADYYKKYDDIFANMQPGIFNTYYRFCKILNGVASPQCMEEFLSLPKEAYRAIYWATKAGKIPSDLIPAWKYTPPAYLPRKLYITSVAIVDWLDDYMPNWREKTSVIIDPLVRINDSTQMPEQSLAMFPVLARLVRDGPAKVTFACRKSRWKEGDDLRLWKTADLPPREARKFILDWFCNNTQGKIRIYMNRERIVHGFNDEFIDYVNSLECIHDAVATYSHSETEYAIVGFLRTCIIHDNLVCAKHLLSSYNSTDRHDLWQFARSDEMRKLVPYSMYYAIDSLFTSVKTVLEQPLRYSIICVNTFITALKAVQKPWQFARALKMLRRLIREDKEILGEMLKIHCVIDVSIRLVIDVSTRRVIDIQNAVRLVSK